MKIDQLLPKYDFCKRHELFVPASPEKVYEAYKQVDFSDSQVVDILMRIRGLKGKGSKNFIHDHFRVYYDDRKEVVLGIVAQPWKYRGNLRSMSLPDFIAFEEAGWAKILWNFTFEEKEGGTLLGTETRILCTDPTSLWKFRIYWSVVAPLSGWTRHAMLKLIKQKAFS